MSYELMTQAANVVGGKASCRRRTSGQFALAESH